MQEIQDRAIKRVQEKKGFYVHLAIYLTMGVFFFVVNLVTRDYPSDWWFYWPLLGWGIGIAMHYFSVFGLPFGKILTPEWEEREIERELRRLGADPDHRSTSEDEYLDLDDRGLQIKTEVRKSSDRWNEDELV